MADSVGTNRSGNLADRGSAGPRDGLRRSEARTGSAQPREDEPSYYDISMLKAPLWKWEIASYFFLGGLSAGAYLLGRVAARAGGERHRDIARVASSIAFAALLPCPPLLIHDLGDPKRFHHMMRVWKPSSPMNLGTWTLLAYSGMVTFEVVRQYLDDHRGKLSPALYKQLKGAMNNSTVLLVHDAAGVPFAVLLAGYTGVLLSCTANPLWARNSWLGPLFSASAIASGAEAINLALSLTSRSSQTSSQQALNVIDSMAHAIELACMEAFKRAAGEKGRVLETGPMAAFQRFAHSAIFGSEALKYLPLRGQLRRWVRVVASSLGLAGGFATRWAMVHGGRDAALDPHTARLSSRREVDAYNQSRRQIGTDASVTKRGDQS